MNFRKLFLVVYLIGGSALLVEHKDLRVAAEKRESQTGYQLIWADEFDQSGRPNPKNWTYDIGFLRNEELQWYQPQNAWCENGMLIIEGRRERKLNASFQSGSKDWVKNREYAEYTSQA